MTDTRREYIVLIIIGCIFAILIGRATIIGRAQVRDELRRQDITNLKRASEQYFNDHMFYVSPPSGAVSSPSPVCTSAGANSWFFTDASPLLQERFLDAIPHDLRESKGRSYRYCAIVDKYHKAIGYTLEAELEVPTKVGIFFDEDELRKFHYRIKEIGNQTVYQVCGGTETSCTP